MKYDSNELERETEKMTETTKEIFLKFQVRKSAKEKTSFIDFLESFASKRGLRFTVEKGASKSRNVVIGDIERAKILYTAHYDTCSKTPFPNLITPKSIPCYLIYQFLIIGVFLAIAFCAAFIVSRFTSSFDPEDRIPYFVGLAVYFGFLFLLLYGPSNRHTANDNTSGVTLLLDIIEDMPDELRSQCAFVFFDLEERGLVGSKSFAKSHKALMKDKPVVNFDCVSDGDTMFFYLKRKARPLRPILSEAFVSTDKYKVEFGEKWAVYPSDQGNFPIGVGVAALKRSKKFNILYLDRIHTEKDTVYDEENISYLKDGAIRLAAILSEN